MNGWLSRALVREDAIADSLLRAISVQAGARATVMRRHGLHYFEAEDMSALALAMSVACHLAEPRGEISRAAWHAFARGIAACFWITLEERCFMLDQMASHLLDDAGLPLSNEARATMQAVVDGASETVAA